MGEYLLDAGVLIALQRTWHINILAGVAAHFAILVVEEVYDELTDPRNGKYSTEAKQAKATLDSYATTIAIDPTSQEGLRLDALRVRRAKSTRADLGEDASVAWAVDHPGCVFVTRDSAAAFLALNELRGRAMTFFHFLREMVDKQAIDVEMAQNIANAAVVTNGVKAVPPLWWADWIATK